MVVVGRKEDNAVHKKTYNKERIFFSHLFVYHDSSLRFKWHHLLDHFIYFSHTSVAIIQNSYYFVLDFFFLI